MEQLIVTERNKILYSHGVATDSIENVIVSKRDYANILKDLIMGIDSLLGRKWDEVHLFEGLLEVALDYFDIFDVPACVNIGFKFSPTI